MLGKMLPNILLCIHSAASGLDLFGLYDGIEFMDWIVKRDYIMYNAKLLKE